MIDKIFDRDLTQTDKGKEIMFRSVLQELKNTNRGESRDTKCYKIYNGEINDDDFSYLTQIGENVLPAKIRWFPLATSKINKLVSQEAQRDVKSRLYASDRRSVAEREKRRSEKLFNTFRKRVEAVNEAYILQSTNVSMARQRYNELAQQEPQNEREQKELADLRANLPLIEHKLNSVQKNLDIDNFLTKKDIEEADRYMTYDDQDIMEEAFQGGIDEAIVKQQIKMKKVNAFRNKTITGKEMFLVHWEPGMVNPIFENLPVRNVKWTTELNAHFIQNCKAAGYETEMSITEVISRYGKHLNNKDLANLVSYANAVVTRGDFVVPTPNNGAVFMDGYHSVAGGKNIKVEFGFWKVNRDIAYTEVPNRHKKGSYFRHVVDGNYKPKKNGEVVQNKFVEDLWEGVCLNDKYYINIRKSKVQLRNFDDSPSFVQLPIIGYSFNDPATKPYSLIWEIRDIQELISILNYHRELMFAMAGVKGIVMDMSQKPDMPDDEWLMDFKRGIAWIESFKGGRQSSFNQFQTYDNTLSPAVGLISEIIVHLDEMVSDVTGVTREAMGKTNPNDQVGTYEMSITASNLITYIMYYEHDILVQMALSRYANLARYAWKDGREGTYMTNLNAKKFFKINPDIAVDRYFDLYLVDSTKENMKLDTIKSIAVQARKNREITLSNLIQILDTDNLKEMSKKVEYFSDKMIEISQNNAMSVEEQKKAVALESIKLKSSYEMQMKQQDVQLKQADLMLKKAELELEKSKMFIDAKLRREEMGSKMQMKGAEIESESAVEMAYLIEEGRMHQVDEAIRVAQVKLDALNVQGQLFLNKEQGDKSHAEQMKKLDVEKTKAKSQGMGKEKIKD